MNKTTQNSTQDKSRRGAKIFVGVDISKAELVCDLANGQRVHDNNPKAIEALLKKLPRNAHVVCEATGGLRSALLGGFGFGAFFAFLAGFGGGDKWGVRNRRSR